MRYESSDGEDKITVGGYIDESLFQMIQREADKRGWSKSQVVADALENRYVRRQDSDGVTVVSPAD